MKEARPAGKRSLLLTVLILISSAFQAFAYYHPDEGRWITRDPIGESGGRNLYGFIQNAPVSVYDVLGLNGGSGASSYGCPGCCGPEEYKKPRKCCLRTPLVIGFVSRIQTSEHVGISFFMHATFRDNSFDGGVLCCAACCRFAQQVKAKAYYKGSLQVPPGDDFANHPGWESIPEEFNGTGGRYYSYTSICTHHGACYTTFNGGDIPGAGSFSGSIKAGDTFSMLFSFRGYIKDLCNDSKLIGPRRLYGFNANGTFPNVLIEPWGFDP